MPTGYATDTLQRALLAAMGGDPNAGEGSNLPVGSIGRAQVVSGNITAINGSVGGDFDALNFQSVGLQIGNAAFVGTVTFQTSNDGVRWDTKALTTASGGQGSGATSAGSWFGDIGARYFRVLMSAFTSGTAQITLIFSAFSLAPPGVGSVSVTNVPGTLPYTTTLNNVDTTTNLAAGATYTGTTRDSGSSANAWSSRVRPIIRHLTATPVHGYLTLEESPDNFTTTIETRRVAIPADGQYHSFDWPIHLRYWRLKFINGNQAQTGMRLDSTTYRGEGSSVDEDKVLNFVLSTTALGASAAFTSQTFDLGPNAARNLFRAFARSDQASGSGGFRVEWSDDNTNWYFNQAEAVTTVAAQGSLIESKAIARYARVVYTNGATAQTGFRLWATLVSL